jgi:signal transduction histidine kinase
VTLKSYLYSIFYNLISNSIKFRQKQVPCIIEIKSNLLKNNVELIFTDNGMGIDLKKKGDHIFGLYKRFHPHTEGKGMGLFMVKTQVETLSGKISIESEVNKGTQFRIEFER